MGFTNSVGTRCVFVMRWCRWEMDLDHGLEGWGDVMYV